MKTMKKRAGLIVCLLAGCIPAAFAAGIATPLVVWDVDFNGQPLDAAPIGMSKEQLEKFNTAGDLSWTPLKTRYWLTYVTRTRQAKVVKAAAGLTDQPLLFTYTENAQPHYGPQVWFAVPPELAARAKKWKLSLDVSKGNVSISGGLNLWNVVDILFHEDGTVRANGAQVARYAAGKPLHLDCVINVPEKTVTVMIDGDPAKRVSLSWRQPKAASFSGLRLDGLLPGGHAEAPSSIAFDNIRLTLAETLKQESP